MEPLELQVTTANICGNPIRAKRAVKRRMRQALHFPGATFGQEVAGSNHFRVPPRGDYSTAWHHLAVKQHKVTYGGRHEVPISVPDNWLVIDHEVIRVHGGLRMVSPDRFINVVTVMPTRESIPISLIDCHPVSKPREGVYKSKWRIAKWDIYHEVLASIVAHLHNQGRLVVVGGDMNKITVPSIHPAQQQVIHSGLDHLWAIPADGQKVTVLGHKTVNRTVLMDHPILSVKLKVEAV